MKRVFTKLVACTLLAFLLCGFFDITPTNAQGYTQEQATKIEEVARQQEEARQQREIEALENKITPPAWLQKEIDAVKEARKGDEPSSDSLNYFGLTSEETDSMLNAFSEEEARSYVEYQSNKFDIEKQIDLIKGKKEAVDAGVICRFADFGCYFVKAMNGYGIDVSGFGGFLISIFNWILYAIVSVLSVFLGFSATFLDVFLQITLNIGTLVKSIPSINTVWALIRDTFNITFIFIMLYIAIGTIIRSKKVVYKQMIISVIISALLINFSLFITKVVIDASNLVTMAFYSRITLKSATYNITDTTSISEQTISKTTKATLSATVMSGLNLDSLISISSPKNISAKDGSLPVGLNLTALLVIQIILYGLLIWAFIVAGFLLLARTLAFVFLLATSPVGFIGDVIPKISKYTKQWHETLVNQCLVAPIFLFFMFLLSRLIGSGLGNFVGDQSTKVELMGGLNLSAFVNFAIIIGFIIGSVKITKETSGKIGSMITDYAKSGLGLMAGLATGGVALAGRKIIGAGAASLASSKAGASLTESALNGSAGARLALKAINGAQSSTFDLRNNKMANSWAKKTGVDIGAGTKKTYESVLGEETKKDEAFIKLTEKYKKENKHFQEALTVDAFNKNNEETKRKEEDHTKKTAEEQAELDKIKAEKQAGLASITDPIKKERDEAEKNKKDMEAKMAEIDKRKNSPITANESKQLDEEKKILEQQINQTTEKIKESQNKINTEEKKVNEEINKKEREIDQIRKNREKAIDEAKNLFVVGGVDQKTRDERKKKIDELEKKVYEDRVNSYATIIEAPVKVFGIKVPKKVFGYETPITMTKKARAKAIRGKIKGKTKQQELEDAVLAREKERKEEEERNGGRSPAPAAPTPTPTPTPTRT